MTEMAVVGTEIFTLGFRLTGLNKVFTLNEENPDQTIKDVIGYPEIGLVIMEDRTLQMLSESTKDMVLESISPVFLTISEQDSNEEMRKLVRKSIGVDLWSKEER